MKGKYVVQVLGIAVSLFCLNSCAKQSSLTSKPSSELDESKMSVAKTDSEKNVLSSKPSESKTQENVVSGLDETKQKETSDNDKILADLAKKLGKSKLDKFSDSFVLCTVNNVPITVGDYRRQFKSEQQQVQASLTMNPEVTSNLIRTAQEQGVTLSLDEKKRLADSAMRMQKGGTKSFDKMLAENRMTKAQFRDQVLDVGLAFKMANLVIEDGLINELVNRSILAQAAKENGFSKDAMKKYTEVAQSPEYKRLLEVSGISGDDLRNEIIGNELCLKQIDKIKKESPITDVEISNYYEKNRGKFRHGARIRLSQIFIARGSKVGESEQDMGMRLKKENPSLSTGDINKLVQEQIKKKSDLAQDILNRAHKGEDFATLANQYSEDLVKSTQKNGGDLGFQEESKLDKSFADKITKIPAGGVTSEVITSPYGFHIFKVTAKESPGYYKLSEVKETLKDLLTEEKGQQVLDDWLAEGRQKATIVVSPEMKNMIASNKLEKR